ncbi:M20 family peptidase [Microbulbifer magnicolonia]|uniref:M20 family peptidase n=1 Tax=Microbulbifer magnicolonia TaxID=3109744 RepID=UPI002B40E8E1|nr:M20 family peptidase [Microbulbifer sp. GG15]
MKKILIGTALILCVLTALVLLRTASYSAPPLAAVERASVELDRAQIARHLSEAIRFRTISSQLEEPQTQAQYEQFIAWLAATYPELHRALPPARLGRNPQRQYSLLFTWPGKNADLPPILLSAHYDVVPVIPGTEDEWQQPPYDGVVDDTHIWGRGALDDKSAAIALMETATQLLAQNFQPERTVYIALTHDEETGGEEGTAAIVEKLQQDGVKPAWSLDEGSFLLHGFIPGIDGPVASINVAEKGYMTVDLVARGQGGHSSMPPRDTAVDILAQALVNIHGAPLPSGLEGLSGEMFDAIAPHMPFGQRLLFANRWLFGGLIDSALEAQPGTAAMLHTTVAPTMLSASVKENVLPIEAVATINLRVHPRDHIEDIAQHLKSAINDDRVEVKLRRGQPASRVSSADAAGFKAIAEAAQKTYGPTIVAPGLTIAGTDSRRYETIADNSYRFNPMVVTREDTSGFHGTNERISIENMANATNFYRLLIEQAGAD